ncbi:hypothetical protein [Stenotrophomonas lactitubi]|uniref:Uncharacterized protein n=1 Tax=Stenotrophomonas lactitubi TaxID=2045214 RepID=A0ABS2VC28_9GAMM|nr:hypothetical protein [Stenotrophomonas lactitubi]MBM9923996.1 hypothetical protein [Stenotrophomonas lactitubi]MBM9938837.1 hypothetical protein [Stenotrophomonas lactitubi]
MPVSPVHPAFTRYSSPIVATLFGLCCSGCIDGKSPKADGNQQGTTEESSIGQRHPDTPDSANPRCRTLSNQGISASSENRTERTSEYLLVESGFMANRGISSQTAEDLLRSSRSTHDAIDRMTIDAASSPDAQDLARHYRSSLLRAMDQNTVLERLACGLSICIGIARARSNADHEAWGQRLASDRSSPTYGYVETSEGLGAEYENRFMFSTDPELNSISGN